MLEGLEQADVNKIKEVIAQKVNDLGVIVAECKGRNCEYTYGQIIGLILAHRLIGQAQEGEL